MKKKWLGKNCLLLAVLSRSRQISTSRRGLSAGTAPSCGDPSLLSTHLTTRRGREILYHACAALDRAEDCAAQIAIDGPVLRTKSGIREHPALRCELASRSFCVRTLARLGLDYEPVKAVGCPPSSYGFKGDD